MNNASEMNSHDNNKGTGSDNQSVHENENAQGVISMISTQSSRDPEIIPLTSISGLPVDKFDFELLPQSLQAWAIDIQHRLQCPADYVGVGIMVGLAASIGNKVTVQPKSNDHSWKVVPNLWGLLIGSPSSMKSPAMDAALKHVSKIEEVLRQQLDLASLLKPPRLIVRDTTIEKLQIIQGDNPAGILYVQDEISALFRKFEQPSSTDRQYLLEAFNGNSSYSVDRVSRGSVFIKKNTLSLIGTIQPDVLKSIFLSQTSSNDGFMQRLQLAVWPDPVKQEYIDSLPDEDANRLAWSIFTGLYQLKARNLKFCEQAQIVFVDWYKQTIQAIDELLKEGQVDLSSHVTKYRNLVPSLALIIELTEDSEASCITESSITKAVLWANYLITHAKRIYSIQDKSAVIAELLLDKRDRLKFGFSPSEVTQNSWGGLVKTEDIKQGIAVLERHNYLFKINKTTSSKGGRPSEKYRWNNTL